VFKTNAVKGYITNNIREEVIRIKGKKDEINEEIDRDNQTTTYHTAHIAFARSMFLENINLHLVSLTSNHDLILKTNYTWTNEN